MIMKLLLSGAMILIATTIVFTQPKPKSKNKINKKQAKHLVVKSRDLKKYKDIVNKHDPE